MDCIHWRVPGQSRRLRHSSQRWRCSASDLHVRHRARGFLALRSEQHGGHRDPRFEEHRIPVPADGLERLDESSVHGSCHRRSVATDASGSWRLSQLQPRWHCLAGSYSNVSQSFQKSSRMRSSMERCRHCSRPIARACCRSAMKSVASFAPVSFPNTTASTSSLNNTLR